MSGIATYLMKLPPAQLGPAYAQPLDYKLARSFPPSAMRLRLRRVARLLAEGVIEAVNRRPDPPGRLELINIGGGPAVDTWNALLLLRKERPEVVEGKHIRIRVLDRDHAGPSFGAGAVTALRADGGPLHGLDVSFEHVPYDWTDPGSLRRLLAAEVGTDAVVVISSEGALFDYGTDEHIVENLVALRGYAPADVSVCGDFVPDNEVNRLSARETMLSARLFTPTAFADLVARAGFRIAPPLDPASSESNCRRLVLR